MKRMLFGLVVLVGCATVPAPEPAPAPVVKRALAPSTPEGIALFQRMTFAEIKKKLTLPDHLKHRPLAAAVYLKMDEEGRVTDMKVRRSSGNPEFDSLALQAIRDAQPLPTPPKEAVLDGMLIDFLPF